MSTPASKGNGKKKQKKPHSSSTPSNNENELAKLKEELEELKRHNEVLRLKQELAIAQDETAKLSSHIASKQAASPREGKECVDDDWTAYVGGLPYSETEESIGSYFGDVCGPVAKIRLKGFTDNQEKFCGIAFVTFADRSGLEACLALDGSTYGERTLKVRRDRQPKRASPPRVGDSLTVYAGNMPYDATRQQVEQLFCDNGCQVASLRYHTDPENQRFRGFCHVDFADEESLEAALHLAGTDFKGRQLRIMHSLTKKPTEKKGRSADDDAKSCKKQKSR